jgi:protoheme IX farnesyltransferase
VRRMLVYTAALVAFTVVPFATGSFGLLYLGGALALGGAFLALVLRLRRHPERRVAALVFHYSLLYLALVFAAAAADASV